MSVTDLVIELARWRAGDERPSNAQSLTTGQALEYRSQGNLPDALDRSLRLVLIVDERQDPRSLEIKRLEYEPDYHSAPTWRIEGSRPVNVVPLVRQAIEKEERAWWESDDMAPLEKEWQSSGSVGGIAIPADLRGFVFKTIVSLRSTDREVTVDSITQSIQRWLSPEDASRIGVELRAANS